MFADDTAIFTDDKIGDHENNVNNSLKIIIGWLRNNNLKINLRKILIMTLKNYTYNYNYTNFDTIR